MNLSVTNAADRQRSFKILRADYEQPLKCTIRNGPHTARDVQF